MALETWRPVPGWSAYEVSDIGSVRGLARRATDGRLVRGRVLKASISTGKYRKVHLYQDGNKRGVHVHVLVLQAFVGERPEGSVTRHLDGDSLNNLLENLAWGTAAENAQDAIKHGTWATKNRTRCPKDHPLEPPNLVEWQAKRGRRMCKTCRDERNRARHPRDANGEFMPRKYTPRRYSQPRGPQLDAVEITQKYVNGAGLVGLAREYRTSGSRIRECILSQGVQVRSRGGYHRTSKTGSQA